MGRALLILCAVALLTACRSEEHPPVVLAAADSAAVTVDGHAELTCAACHRGALADNRRASVPGGACTESGCHNERGPAQVSTKTATFPHRDHGSDSDVALSCAGCHTHKQGNEQLRVSVDACALCHLTDLGGGSPDDCRLCHQKLDHIASTSQALQIPHSTIPWVETGCVRCHYDVAEPATRVGITRCNNCHGRDTTTLARGVGTDLHPGHESINCTSCHEEGSHHVRAMSSAVSLACADCHQTAHAVEYVGMVPATVCNDCHTTVHQPQQRLLLGLLPQETLAPSAHFTAGLTCRSCHASGSVATANGDSNRGHAASCGACHPPEYRRVLQWWIDGTRLRTSLTATYLTRARNELRGAASDSLLRGAGELVDFVRTAGGEHNVELSDRMLRLSIERIGAAYRRAGRAVPEPPQLGSAAHQGTCSFCHYSATESWDFRRMSGPFHRSVLGLDR